MSEVRFARAEDIPALVDLGRQMHVRSRYAWMQFNASRLWNSLESAVGSKQHCLIIAADKNSTLSAQTTDEAGFDNAIGVLWACVMGLPFSSDLVAQIDYLYVQPRYRGTPAAMKMMAGLRRWANNRQVSEILLPNAFGAEQGYSAKWLAKLGMQPVGGVHSMWVDR